MVVTLITSKVPCALWWYPFSQVVSCALWWYPCSQVKCRVLYGCIRADR